ncbi:hypothetical protein CRE_10930 [Caenorhabditis remanei]|uniref:Uncharacterized protein n=1 Tax=Caenorhabditis remanei TaxID=31234 RepID=E3M5K5_CAERE|nr:hypothetical protein CRE_10930 [Caenorhabditis remanei]
MVALVLKSRINGWIPGNIRHRAVLVDRQKDPCVQLISATFVTSGIATILQTTFGMRFSILHGPSFAFIPALHTFQTEFPCNSDTSTNNWEEKMQMVPDSFLFILRLNDYQISGSCSRFHWSYRKDFEIYRTSYNSPNYEFIDNWHRARYRKENGIALDLYCRFQYLLGIIIAWIICLILTVTNWEPPGGEARTDKNVSLAVFEETPWVQIPKPLFFGAPKFNAALICGFMASCFAAMIESIGDYTLWGVGTGIKKFAAFLSMISEPIIGGLLAMGVCLINGVSLSNLQTVDMKISRNLTIIGIAIIMSITTASHFEKTPLNTGNKTVNDVFGTLLTIRMLIGGLIAFTLDNIAPGATRKQRGFVDDDDYEDDNEKEALTSVEHNGYALPSSGNQFLLRYPWLTYLPVIPSRKEIEDIEDEKQGDIGKEKILC